MQFQLYCIVTEIAAVRSLTSAENFIFLVLGIKLH